MVGECDPAAVGGGEVAFVLRLPFGSLRLPRSVGVGLFEFGVAVCFVPSSVCAGFPFADGALLGGADGYPVAGSLVCARASMCIQVRVVGLLVRNWSMSMTAGPLVGEFPYAVLRR